MQVLQSGFEHGLGIAPNLDFTFSNGQLRMFGPGLADEVAELAQTVFSQRLHHFISDGGIDLNHHAQLFIEQDFERQLLAAHADLTGPIFAVAHVHAAVVDSVTFDQQYVDV